VKQVNFRVDLIRYPVGEKNLCVELTRFIVGSTRTGTVQLTTQRADATRKKKLITVLVPVDLEVPKSHAGCQHHNPEFFGNFTLILVGSC
jgi:hypothetical protein